MRSDGLSCRCCSETSRFPAGEWEEKRRVSHFISSCFLEKQKVWEEELHLCISDTKSDVAVHLQPSSCCFFSWFNYIPAQFRALRKGSESSEPTPFTARGNISPEAVMHSDVNLWCRLNLWVNIKKEGSYNLLRSSFCSGERESSRLVFQFFVWFCLSSRLL